MEKIFELMLSRDPEIKKLGITMLKETRFYIENKDKLVSDNFILDFNLSECVDNIERKDRPNPISFRYIQRFWILLKNKYNEFGN